MKTKSCLVRHLEKSDQSFFFDTIKRYSEKKMEQLKFPELNSIFEVIIHKYIIGLMIDGKFVLLQEEDGNVDTSVVVIIRERFSTSVLFKVILEAILLIVRLRTTCQLDLEHFYIYHVGCTFNLHSMINNGLTFRGQKFEQKTNSVFLAC